MTRKIVVASTNPVKILSAQEGFQKMFPQETFETLPVQVESNVSAQPMTDLETRAGAQNRAANAKTNYPNADYWVGIEGGVDVCEGHMHAFAWIVILGTERCGEARSASFLLPKALSDLIVAGVELGEADDMFFGRQNSKRENGAVGLLTDDAVDRKSLYIMPVILALIPFKQEQIYPPE